MAADSLIFGRVTYEAFASAWPHKRQLLTRKYGARRVLGVATLAAMEQ